ncbi:ion transporter [Lentisphaera profundi]|uniref:Ion transporter n=1 Tax=Lentisphaera profundi TaxID=1658616 RepID=A0ABY7VSP6_9BACT|nr:ion transporter [Lentisphaera profundi]WDE96742.1 ion transporter [Lentisphaera profundi]
MERQAWQEKVHEIIYEADTPAGKLFDLALIASIIISVIAIMLDSIPSINASHGDLLYKVEWAFTVTFTIEYILRIISIKRSRSYIFSFLGIIDLLSILPTYLGLFVTGQGHYLAIVRLFRVLRIFRILKLAQYLKEASILISALHASKRKIFVFFCTVIVLVTILGSIMYIVESSSNPVFKSIPHSIYWAIVTITTVGYGDMAPITGLGRFIAAIVMLLGYAIIAVPSGIITSELTQAVKNQFNNTTSCPSCAHHSHENDAIHCKVCGEKL